MRYLNNVYPEEKFKEKKPKLELSAKDENGCIDQVWFNPEKGTTVVRWIDGSKTISRCQEGDVFDKEKGLTICYLKKFFGKNIHLDKIFSKWCPIEEIKEIKEQNLCTNTISTVVSYNVKDRVDQIKERVESVEEKVNQIEAGLNHEGVDLSQFIDHVLPHHLY